MTKSADALARELAERCAKEIVAEIGYVNFGPFAKCILAQTKLRELCAVAEALRDICALDGGSTFKEDRNELCKSMRRGEQALAALDGGAK